MSMLRSSRVRLSRPPARSWCCASRCRHAVQDRAGFGAGCPRVNDVAVGFVGVEVFGYDHAHPLDRGAPALVLGVQLLVVVAALLREGLGRGSGFLQVSVDPAALIAIATGSTHRSSALERAYVDLPVQTDSSSRFPPPTRPYHCHGLPTEQRRPNPGTPLAGNAPPMGAPRTEHRHGPNP